MLTVSNLLSALRAPLALLFFFKNPVIRVSAIVCAMVTDGLDGFLARRYHSTSQFGAMLDPLMDKFFVSVVLLVLLTENRIAAWELVALLSRDVSVAIFGLYLVFSGRLAKYQFQAIWSGKITTVLQFTTLICLTLGYSIAPWVIVFFVVLGVFALLELSLMRSYVEA